MIGQAIKERDRCIIVDINTQEDFFLAKGGYCINNHGRILERIRRIMAWVRLKYITVISICEIHCENDIDHNYCIQGTDGQNKIGYTLLKNRFSFSTSNSTDLPLDLFYYYQQIILQNRYFDPFHEPMIERLLSEARAEEFILIGASIEGAVLQTTLGLLQRGRNVKVMVDALGLHKKKDAKLALRKMETKGAKLIETKKLVGISHLQRVGICHCLMCKKKTTSGVAALVS